MSLFEKPEVTILKETSDARAYLEKLESFQKEVPQGNELASVIDKEIAITKAGLAGEDAILFELKNSGMDLVVLHDLYIETSDGRGAQIDFLVITPYVNVLIECKNLFGNIEINSKGNFVRSFSYRGRWIKEGIYSPITQNERHLAVFKDCRSEGKNALLRFAMSKNFDLYNRSLVVLANPKTLINDRFAPKEVKQKVIRGDQLVATLKGMKSDLKRSKRDMISIGEKYLALNRNERKEYHIKYQELLDQIRKNETDSDSSFTVNPVSIDPGDRAPAAEVKQNEAEITSDSQLSPFGAIMSDDSLVCPWCGRELVLRTAKKGSNAGKEFYGCSGFPKCRYIKNN